MKGFTSPKSFTFAVLACLLLAGHAGNFNDIYESKADAFAEITAIHLLSVEDGTDDGDLEGATFLHQEDSGDRRRLSEGCKDLMILPIP